MNASSIHPASSVPARGVPSDLRNALGGIWRISSRRVFSRRQLLSLFWTVVVLAGLAFVSIRTGNDDGFHGWTIRLYLTTLIPIIAFMSGAGAIREDMKPGGVDYLLTRPVPRTFFVAARFFSHLVCVQLTSLVAFAAVLAVGWHRGVGDLGSTWPILGLAQVLAVTAFMALGFLFGALTARYLVVGITYAAIVEIGLGQIPITLSNLSVLRHLKAFLMPVTPGASVHLEPQGLLVTMAFLGVFTLGWLTIAAVAFSVQEFAGQRPKDT